MASMACPAARTSGHAWALQPRLMDRRTGTRLPGRTSCPTRARSRTRNHTQPGAPSALWRGFGSGMRDLSRRVRIGCRPAWTAASREEASCKRNGGCTTSPARALSRTRCFPRHIARSCCPPVRGSAAASAVEHGPRRSSRSMLLLRACVAGRIHANKPPFLQCGPTLLRPRQVPRGHRGPSACVQFTGPGAAGHCPHSKFENGSHRAWDQALPADTPPGVPMDRAADVAMGTAPPARGPPMWRRGRLAHLASAGPRSHGRAGSRSSTEWQHGDGGRPEDSAGGHVSTPRPFRI